MEIFIIDANRNVIEAFKTYFDDLKDVKIIYSHLEKFLSCNKVECLVSPANSFGLMDGGYDYAITKHFGCELQEKVQRYIVDNFYGEQPTGTSFLIETDSNPKYLIHTPTMRYPQKINNPEIIYHCMRSCLIEAMKHNIKNILIPAFGGGTGQVSYTTIAYLMRKAYEQLKTLPEKLDWNYVRSLNI